MFEFNKNFNVNTGQLDAIYIGSGVHLQKDVTFSFELIDPMGNSIANDAQLIANQFIDKVIFDVMDTGRNVIYPNYKSGTSSRSITITEKENESIFGSYVPNFGVRVQVTNHLGVTPFISEFYTYANTPEISNYIVHDSSGINDYFLSGFWKFDLKPSLLTGFSVKTQSTGDVKISWGDDPYDLIPDTIYTTGSGVKYFTSASNFVRSGANLVTANISNHTFSKGNVIKVTGVTSPIDFNGIFVVENASSGQFQYKTTGYESAYGIGEVGVSLESGAYYYSGIISPIYDEILVNTSLANNLNYINFEKYDIYASEGSLDDIILFQNEKIPSSQNKHYIFTTKKEGLLDLYKLKILPIGLKYDIPYYFKIVPYSSVGSGRYISIGPHMIRSAPASGESVASSNQFALIHGNSSMNLDFITGMIDNSGLRTIDVIERGIYNTISYTTQITDANKTVYSSELKLVDTYSSSIGSGISLSEYAISNNSNVIYSIENDQSYIYLRISGVIPNAIYKLYKTSI